jgi:hypothetical protein
MTGDCQNCKILQAQAEVFSRVIQEGPHLTKRIRKSLGTLERRATYLEARAAVRESRGEAASLDDIEAAALRWAVLTIKMLAAAGKVQEDATPDLDAIAVQSRLVAEENAGAGNAVAGKDGGSK